ncbi:hypothetical protein HDU67_004650 [Dinochytrium kinnereticum]|nr:hypothetical protein HDU67_004650 [Dinochytrium kinnereticum]
MADNAGPPAVAAAPGAPGAPGQQQQQGGIMSMLQSGLRMLMIYWAITYFMGERFPGKAITIITDLRHATGSILCKGTGGKKSAPPVLNEDTGEYVKVPGKAVSQYFPLWTKSGLPTDLYVYVSEDPEFTDFTDVGKLVWKETDIVFGDLTESRTKSTSVKFSPNVQNNGTLYAHVYLTESGKSPNPIAKSYVEDRTLYHKKVISRYYKKKKVVIKKKLVGDTGKKEEEVVVKAEEDEPVEDLPIISYWWSNLTIAVVPEFNPIPASLPPAVSNRINVHKDGVHFKPVFEVDDFWLMSEHLQPINETVSSGNLTLFYQPKSWWYFTMLCQFEENFRMQNAMMGVEQKETDEIKVCETPAEVSRMFLETNPFLLAVTVFVSLLHSVFDFLAFKNDIAFWQNKKDLDGMSFRAILLNVAFQAVIFLYLLDNDTSWMILISNGAGLLIEAWKIQKTVIIKSKSEFPFVEFIDKFKPSKTARKTMKYDKIAFKYLSYVLYPLLAGYAIYSVYYEEHKSWYSYVVGTLVGFVYMFGFISMTPQLFINYKLKSVAHMPWKTFMYKALNTFIDDVVFLVYLYQRWIYPEDKRRRNEFGQVGEADVDDDDDGIDSDDEAEDSKEKKDVKAKIEAAVKKTEDKPDALDDGLRKRKTAAETAAAPAAAPGKKDSAKTK